MRYQIREQQGWIIIRLSGTAGPDDPARARMALAPFLRKGVPKIILDLQKVGRAALDELSLLWAIRLEVKARAGTLRLCSLQPHVQRCFAGYPFLQVFEVYPTFQAALEGAPELPWRRTT